MINRRVVGCQVEQKISVGGLRFPYPLAPILQAPGMTRGAEVDPPFATLLKKKRLDKQYPSLQE
jgi:hypothetical protein